jgi:hypothetical protein
MSKNYCSQHPNNFEGYSPKEFADKFVNTNFFYQRDVFEELVKRYKKESEGDYKRRSLKDSTKKRTQLASSLEKVAENLEKYVLNSFEEVLKSCRKYMKNVSK